MSTPATADEDLTRLAIACGLLAPGAAEPADPGELLDRLADRFGMRSADLAREPVQPDALQLVPRELAVRHRLLPLARVGGTLRVAVGDPLETEGLDTLAHLLPLGIEPVLVRPSALHRAIERHYGRDAAPVADLAPPAPVTPAVTALPDQEADAPVIGRVLDLIREAVRRRASDIHLEPLSRRLRVRYRVDGVLQEAEDPPKRLQPAILSRMKIMANISIAEKRLPQDGRIQLTVGERPLDLRVSTLPTAHGESIVMRLLDQESLKPGLGELGMGEDDRALLEGLIARPDGMLLVTGPTGSGKTTTLYASLHHLNRPDRKIITVEDPVEYQLSGVNQVPVRPEVGMTFASALRAMLRQAPNVIMVGEIRDLETADIAINASLTGHMVFSTLHTNDAPGAVTRLIDLGVKPYLVAASLRGVLAQRLVRRICPDCSRPHAPSEWERHVLRLDADHAAGMDWRRGRGCPACQGTGYRGRVGLFEVFVLTDALRAMIHAGATAARLRDAARLAGMRTMREDGLRKVSAGLTTVEEVASITVGDSNQPPPSP